MKPAAKVATIFALHSLKPGLLFFQIQICPFICFISYWKIANTFKVYSCYCQGQTGRHWLGQGSCRNVLLFCNTQLCQLPLPLNFQHVPVRWEKLPAHHKSAAAQPSPADGDVSGMELCPAALRGTFHPSLPAANLCGLEALSALTSKFVP